MAHKECYGDWELPPESTRCGLPVSDEQFTKNVRNNCLLDLPNLGIAKEHEKIMVMVCGGPTAKDHTEEIRAKRNDDRYRILCSNRTHDWLISENIIPHYHFIIDPKQSKIQDVQHPHKNVKYLIGICCDPGVFSALDGYDVSRVFAVSGAGKPPDVDIIRVLFPNEEIAYVAGGTMAGLRAMVLANVMGFLTVEFYGFDSCYFNTNENEIPLYYSYDKHRSENIIEAQTDDGRIFLTSPVFASQARQFIIWKHRLAWMNFIIHGDSLTKAINDIDNEKNQPKHNLLITPYHKKMNQELLAREPRGSFGADDPKANYAVSGRQHAGIVSVMAGQIIKTHGKVSVLDYGCGKKTLEQAMPPITGMKFYNYDPCIDGIDEPPEPADLVVCTDVLEHVEPECLENVLDDLKRVTKKLAFVSVATVSASKSYSDGQNAHKIVKDYDWWLPKLKKRFYVLETNVKKDIIFNCVLQAREVK